MKYLVRPEYFFIPRYIFPEIPDYIYLLKEKPKIITLHSEYIYAGRIRFYCIFYEKVCNKTAYGSSNIITIFIKLFKCIDSCVKIFFHALGHSSEPEGD